MFYLLLALTLVTLVYSAMNAAGGQGRPKSRVLGPDDDPEFLRRLGHEDDRPNS